MCVCRRKYMSISSSSISTDRLHQQTAVAAVVVGVKPYLLTYLLPTIPRSGVASNVLMLATVHGICILHGIVPVSVCLQILNSFSICGMGEAIYALQIWQMSRVWQGSPHE